jgi:hypothetical protein
VFLRSWKVPLTTNELQPCDAATCSDFGPLKGLGFNAGSDSRRISAGEWGVRQGHFCFWFCERNGRQYFSRPRYIVLQLRTAQLISPKISCETWAPACECTVRSRDGTLVLSSTIKPMLVTALNMEARASKIASLEFGDVIG